MNYDSFLKKFIVKCFICDIYPIWIENPHEFWVDWCCIISTNYTIVSRNVYR